MRIGWLSEALPYLPSRGGFRLYGANLIRCLARRHEIDLIAFLRDDDHLRLDWAERYCASIDCLPVNGAGLGKRLANVLVSHLKGTPLHHRQDVQSRLRMAVATRRWDVLHVEGAFVGGLVPSELPVARVLSLHDSWTLRCQEMVQASDSFRERLYYAALRLHEPRYERLVYPRFERCVVVADRDRAEVQRVVPSARVALIPYGTDTEYFHPVKVEKEEASLVFHSHLGYAPNVEAATEFTREIFPIVRGQLPDATLHLVGADPVPKVQALASLPGIRLSANLPDLRQAVCSARVYVCAIRHGTGLKSKVLEAMAMRLPVVCYPGSTVGIDCQPGKHLLVANHAQEFAAYVVGLLGDRSRADQIAANGRALVEEKYSWESRARAYEELYREVIVERNGSRLPTVDYRREALPRVGRRSLAR